ncbi:MAG TPA: helix-turn-helix domain-containing protein [Solirubrobacteraceae bacterium]
MKQRTEVTDPRIIKALAHPVRIAILRALDEGEASPVGLARQLGEPVNVVSYHFGQLAALGLIELTSTAPRRGAVEHYYAHAHVDDLDVGEWSRLPRLARRGAAASSVATIASTVTAAVQGDGFAPADSRATSHALELDADGWREAAKEIDGLVKRLKAIERESIKRAKRADGDATESAGLAVLLYAHAE